MLHFPTDSTSTSSSAAYHLQPHNNRYQPPPQQQSSSTTLLQPAIPAATAHPSPYKCDLCSMSFSRKSELKQHTKVHTTKQPTVLSSSSSSAAEPSQILPSTSSSIHMCHVCRQLLGSQQELRHHIDTQHGVYNSNGWTTTAAALDVNKCHECGCFRPVNVRCSLNPFRCEVCTFQLQQQQLQHGRPAPQQHQHHQSGMLQQHPFQPQKHSHSQSPSDSVTVLSNCVVSFILSTRWNWLRTC